ncbi:hypothetical protein [Shewanella xiamenensis]|uniref:hypothetical protein n=1 Tax=Shewanella xiamenensis TaxID=332186 RepID=UPI000C12D5C6|nr:hypothetical protein [Shewanella xiamenensis]PHY63130.1 hypothetical protein CS023_14970 [Shewanella xiamenensis]
MSDEIKELFLISREEFDSNLDNFKVSVKKIIERIEKQQNDIVKDAEIDEEILTKFGLICSEAFTGEGHNFEFPMNLFKSVSFNGTPVEDNLCKLNIQGYLKERIAKSIDTNRAINEEDWLRELTGENLKLNILRKLLRYKTSDSKLYFNVEDNINDISELSRKVLNPVLFSGSSELKQLLRQAKYKQDLADKFDISFVDGYGRNYICHIGNVIVYSIHFSDVNFSLLTTKDLFDSIEIGKLMKRQFVKVNYEPSEIENIGELSINYWMQVALAEEQPCIKTEIKSMQEGR